MRGVRGTAALLALLWMMTAVGPGVPVAAASAAPADGVRVLSFNVCGGYIADCRPTEAAGVWADRVVQHIRDWDSDVAVFQEMCAGQRELLARRLSTGYRVAWWPARTGHYGCGKWLVPEVTANQDFGMAVFMRTGSSTTYAAELTELWDQGRTATAADEQKRAVLCLGGVVRGRDSLACTVHLDGDTVDQGVPESVARMRAWAVGRPIIVGGDFNADPFDPNMGALYSAGGGTGAFREVDEQDRRFFTVGCRQLTACRSGEPTTFAGTDDTGRDKPARKFDYLFGTAHQMRWRTGGSLDPGFSRRDHRILRGEAVWLDDRQPPTVPVVEPTGEQLEPDSRSGWSGAFDMVAGRFTDDGVDDLVVRWYDGAVDLYPGRAGGTLGPPVVVRGTRDGGWSDATDLAAGDFNGDGYDDVAVRWSRNSLFVYDGKAGLRASASVVPVWGLNGVTEITAGDVDGDPQDRRDSLVIRRDDGSLAAFEITGGRPAPTVELLPPGRLSDARHIALGDAYGPQSGATDGHDDLFVRWNSGSLHVFPGGGAGFATWQQIQPGPSDGRNTVVATTLGDVDGDGRDDIVTRMRRQDATPPDDGRLHRYAVGATGVVEQSPLAGTVLGRTRATHVVNGAFTAPGSHEVVTRWENGTVTAPEGVGAAGTRWDGVTDMATADLVGDARDDVVLRQGADTVSVVGVPWRAGASPTTPGTVLSAPPGGWCPATAVAELTAGDVVGDGRGDLVLRCADGAVWGYPVLDRPSTSGPPTSGPLTGGPGVGSPVVVRAAGVTDVLGMYVDRIGGRRAVVLRTADGAASARVEGEHGGFTDGGVVHPAGSWVEAADLTRDASGAMLVRWTSGGVWRYPADTAASVSLAVRSFDDGGVDHVRYTVDAPGTGADAAGWADVRSGRAVIPLDGVAPGVHTVRVAAVDRTGNRSDDLVRLVTVPPAGR